MKVQLLRIGILACFMIFCWSYEDVSAASTCEPYGEIKPNQNPSRQHINCLLTNAALKENVPPEVVKAVATQESGWKRPTNHSTRWWNWDYANYQSTSVRSTKVKI